MGLRTTSNRRPRQVLPAPPPLRRAALVVALLAAAVAAPILAVVTAASASAPPVTYSSQITIPAPPASNFSGASAGGDGWAVALSSTQLFNVFHHQTYLAVNCHNQSDASTCAGYPKTITDTSGNGFSTSGQPGLYLDQATGHLFVYATRISDSTAGVVCIDTTQPASDADPFCGFTPLSAVGDAPLNSAGWSGITDPALVGSDWYAFNDVAGTPSGTKDELMCFDVSTGAACAAQPYQVALGTTSVALPTPSPGIVASGGLVVIEVDNSSNLELTCFDPSTGTTCAGSWPAAASTYAGGDPFPLLDSSGNETGVCVPNGSDPCFNLSGASVTTPLGLGSVVTQDATWDGTAAVVGTNIYVPNGNDNSVQCYDFATDASCANFPLALGNLSLLYTVNPDPYRPTCLWVNSNGGTDQIQSFDAITGGTCAQAPIRIQASSFVAPQVACVPSSFTSLQVLSPSPSGYTSGTVSFESSNFLPIAGVGTYNLDSTGSVDLSSLALPTTDALPQFVLTLSGVSGGLGSVTVQISWAGSYDPSCVTPSATVSGATAPGAPTGVGATGVSGGSSVSWTVPGSDGYSPIESYLVTARTSSGASLGTCTATAPATSCTVGGLPDGGPYSFSVVAVNAVGDSPVATGSGYAGVPAAPQPPTAVQASAGVGSASVSWAAPSDTGSEALSSYLVTAYDASGSPAGSCSATPPATSCTVSGLTAGEAYTFAVEAVNSVGSSAPSAPSTPAIPLAPPASTPQPPSPPTAPPAPSLLHSSLQAGSRHSASLVVNWSAVPSSAGGALEYLVTVEPGGKTCTSTSTSCTVSGLVPGVSYSYTVVASAGGASSESTPLDAGSPRLTAKAAPLRITPSSAPVALRCADQSCIGTASISVARPLMRHGFQVGWRHLVLASTRVELAAGQRLTLKLIDTLLGKKLLPRQIRWWMAHQPRFRVTLTTSIVGRPTGHRPVYLR